MKNCNIDYYYNTYRTPFERQKLFVEELIFQEYISTLN